MRKPTYRFSFPISHTRARFTQNITHDLRIKHTLINQPKKILPFRQHFPEHSACLPDHRPFEGPTPASKSGKSWDNIVVCFNYHIGKAKRRFSCLQQKCSLVSRQSITFVFSPFARTFSSFFQLENVVKQCRQDGFNLVITSCFCCGGGDQHLLSLGDCRCKNINRGQSSILYFGALRKRNVWRKTNTHYRMPSPTEHEKRQQFLIQNNAGKFVRQ